MGVCTGSPSDRWTWERDGQSECASEMGGRRELWVRFSSLLERLFPGTCPGTACPTKPTAAGLRRGGPPGEESVGQRFTFL